MNIFIGIGRIARDLELNSLQSGTKVVKFAIAINSSRKNEKGEYISDFINCIAFNKTAEIICQHFKKGERIGVEGRLQSGSYEKDGRTVYTTDVLVNQVSFIETKESKGQQPFNEPQPRNTVKGANVNDDFGTFDPPFDIEPEMPF